jgi:hypothetical protein
MFAAFVPLGQIIHYRGSKCNGFNQRLSAFVSCLTVAQPRVRWSGTQQVASSRKPDAQLFVLLHFEVMQLIVGWPVSRVGT